MDVGTVEEGTIADVLRSRSRTYLRMERWKPRPGAYRKWERPIKQFNPLGGSDDFAITTSFPRAVRAFTRCRPQYYCAISRIPR